MSLGLSQVHSRLAGVPNVIRCTSDFFSGLPEHSELTESIHEITMKLSFLMIYLPKGIPLPCFQSSGHGKFFFFISCGRPPR